MCIIVEDMLVKSHATEVCSLQRACMCIYMLGELNWNITNTLSSRRIGKHTTTPCVIIGPILIWGGIQPEASKQVCLHYIKEQFRIDGGWPSTAHIDIWCTVAVVPTMVLRFMSPSCVLIYIQPPLHVVYTEYVYTLLLSYRVNTGVTQHYCMHILSD